MGYWHELKQSRIWLQSAAWYPGFASSGLAYGGIKGLKLMALTGRLLHTLRLYSHISHTVRISHIDRRAIKLTNRSRWHVCLYYGNDLRRFRIFQWVLISSSIREKIYWPTQLLVHTFNTSSFITTYFPIPFFAVLFFAYKFWNKSKMISYADMDFTTGSSMDIPEEVWLNRVSNIICKVLLYTNEFIAGTSNTLEKDSRKNLIG